MNEIRKLIPATNDWSDTTLLFVFLIFISIIIFFIYLVIFFICSIFNNSSSINDNEIDQLRRKKNRMRKAFSNSILRRDVIVEMDGNKPICSKEFYTCTTYKPIVQTDENIFSQSLIEEN
ncbi:Hypothetical protein SRAE_1000246500 [Strongyloides ratti]|uniref:Uncharacterized protein n=1 Tax=Strongyloides ratti TaxID=34506 RepID=A0A090L9R3_STRRB|nr:Hypothetical protein SRAE_1000246500 [Strongyloides ratti]CEF64210.1 Hypothetical protein SRAE_1000246500 [Strongyloides ratti]